MGLAESCKVPVVAQIVDLIQKGVVKNRTFLQFAFDLVEVDATEMFPP